MKHALGTLLAVALLTAPAVAADKPNFSGNWKMNVTKSNFGVLPAPNSITRQITHAEPALTIVEEQDSPAGAQKTTRVYTTDGKETTFQASGTDVKTAAAWEGDVLVVISNVEAAGLRFTDRMTLSTDGNELTSAVHISSPQGDVDLLVVFERHNPD